MTYNQLLTNYKKKHKTLVRPNQGWESLNSTLWLAYSMGRRRSFTDLGTYNPASRLPSGAKSDHAYSPSWAFDLGRPGWKGLWGFGLIAANKYANLLVEHHAALNIEYVIVGRRIWSRARGWHAYTGGGHDNHIHVSGRH